MQTTTSYRVAANVRAELARQQISTARFSDLLGLSQSSTSRRLSGRQPLNVNELITISTFLGIDPSVLLDGPQPNTAAA